MNRAMSRASIANGRKLVRLGWSDFEDATEAFNMITGPRPRFVKGYKNNLYTVQQFERSSEWGLITLLMVRRNDQEPVRNWTHMQRIKNELMGRERVAVEVYPAESDLVDDANMYHLWVMPEDFALPFGLHLK